MLSFFLYLIVFLYGLVVGSFLNVCILRLPLKESIVTEHSHCMSCGHRLAWYDLFPLFSYLALKGRCRYCGTKISVQYPLVEALNAVGWLACFFFGGSLNPDFNADAYGILCIVLECFLCSALIVLSVIDFRTYEIPFGINVFIFVLGALKLILNLTIGSKGFLEYIIGFFAVAGFLLLLYLITKGRGIGGGDIKLMAAGGLFLGWRLSVLSLILGCLFGSIIHIVRMKIAGEGRVLALGPYLSAGMLIALWFGGPIIEWYLSLF